MSIGPVEQFGFTPMVPPLLPSAGASGVSATAAEGVSAAAGVSGSSPSAGADFGQMLNQGLQNLQTLHNSADRLAVQAATGDLNALHDYTITATEAAVATQLTTAVRNKALESFQEIMRMAI